MEIIEVAEFARDLRKIKIDLEEDLKRYKKVLRTYNPDFKCSGVGAVEISNLWEGIVPVYKSKKFRCKALKKGSRSPVRIIFIHNKYEDEIIFIEIYLKNRKENHDLDRIKKYAIKKMD